MGEAPPLKYEVWAEQWPMELGLEPEAPTQLHPQLPTWSQDVLNLLIPSSVSPKIFFKSMPQTLAIARVLCSVKGGGKQNSGVLETPHSVQVSLRR